MRKMLMFVGSKLPYTLLSLLLCFVNSYALSLFVAFYIDSRIHHYFEAAAGAAAMMITMVAIGPFVSIVLTVVIGIICYFLWRFKKYYYLGVIDFIQMLITVLFIAVVIIFG